MSRSAFMVSDPLYTRVMKWYRVQPFSLPLANAGIRTALCARYGVQRLRISLLLHGILRRSTSGKFDRFSCFSGSALVRSGTTFLANLLNREIANTITLHEAVIDDYWSYRRAFYSEAEALRYIRSFRRNEIFLRLRGTRIRVYGEINPFLGAMRWLSRRSFPMPTSSMSSAMAGTWCGRSRQRVFRGKGPSVSSTDSSARAVLICAAVVGDDAL